MPGSNNRKPSDVNRPPASRVADELQQLAEDVDPSEDVDEAALEEQAKRQAQTTGWDHPMTDPAQSDTVDD
jgi:hypothetical protein